MNQDLLSAASYIRETLQSLFSDRSRRANKRFLNAVLYLIDQPETPQEREHLLSLIGIIGDLLSSPNDCISKKCLNASERFAKLDYSLAPANTEDYPHPALLRLSALLDLIHQLQQSTQPSARSFGVSSNCETFVLVHLGLGLMELYHRKSLDPNEDKAQLDHLCRLMEFSFCRTLAYAVIYAGSCSSAGFPNQSLIISQMCRFANEAAVPIPKVFFALAAFYEAYHSKKRSSCQSGADATDAAMCAARLLSNAGTLKLFISELNNLGYPSKKEAIAKIAAPLLERSIDDLIDDLSN